MQASALGVDMRRREFIVLFFSPIIAWPIAAPAQEAERVRRIGVLTNYPENDPEERRRLAAFNSRLHELGWVNGRNLRIDTSFAGDSGEHVRGAAVDLAARAPEVILSTTSTTGHALLDANS